MNTSFYDTQFYRIKGGDAGCLSPPPSPVIFEMTTLTPENYISFKSRKGINPKEYLPCLYTKAVSAMFLGLKFDSKAIFGSKICNMNFPFLGGKDFQ